MRDDDEEKPPDEQSEVNQRTPTKHGRDRFNSHYLSLFELTVT
jgi:hypothetical protein